MAYVLDDGTPITGGLGAYTLDDESTGALRRSADYGLSLVKSAIGVPEAAVGIADLVTGGHAGKLAEDIGFRPAAAREFLDQYLSPAQQRANKTVSDAKGFLPTIGAAVSNPSTIAHSVVESVFPMLGGGAVARGALAAAPRMGPLVAGALGEGVVSAGSTAEQVRQQTEDGLLTPKQAALSFGSGAATAGIGVAGGALNKRLGITDIDTWVAGGNAATKPAKPGLLTPYIEKGGMPARVAAGALSEGVIEELPQSMQEQAAQNLALDKPVMERVPESGAMGMLAGMVMGGGAGVVTRNPVDEAKEKAQDDPKQAAAGLVRQAVQDISTGQDTLTEKVPYAREREALEAVLGAPEQRQSLTDEDRKFLLDSGFVRRNDRGGATILPAARRRFKQLSEEQENDRTQPDTATGEQTAAQDAPTQTEQPAQETIVSRETSTTGGVQGSEDATNTNTKDAQTPAPLPVDRVPASAVDAAAHEAASSPTNDRKEPSGKQIEANNAKLGHIDLKAAGVKISVENPAGSVREDKKNTPPKWRTKMKGAHYGYLPGTVAHDSTKNKWQGLDAFVKEGTPEDWAGTVYVINQGNDAGGFDEHKSFFGAASEAEARSLYAGTYDKPAAARRRIRSVVAMPMEQFKAWAYDKENGPAKGELAATKQPVGEHGGQPDSAEKLPAYERKTKAVNVARRLTAAGQRHKVIPHPTEKGRFAVVPVETREPSPAQIVARAAAARRFAEANAARRRPDRTKDSLNAFIAKRGGIAMSERDDIIGEGNKAWNGTQWLFRNGGEQVDELASRLHEDGYLTDAEMAIDGGVSILKNKIAEEFNGQRLHYSAYNNQQAEKPDEIDELEANAGGLGIDVAGMSPDEMRAAVAQAVAVPEVIVEAGLDPTLERISLVDVLAKLTPAQMAQWDEDHANSPDDVAYEAARIMAAENENDTRGTAEVDAGGQDAAGTPAEPAVPAEAEGEVDESETGGSGNKDARAGSSGDAKGSAGAGRNTIPAERVGAGPIYDSAETKEQSPLELTQQSPEELRALEAEREAKAKADKAESDRIEAEERAKREREEIKQRSEAAAAGFQLGQSAEDNLSGQGGLFDAPASSLSAPDLLRAAAAKMEEGDGAPNSFGRQIKALTSVAARSGWRLGVSPGPDRITLFRFEGDAVTRLMASRVSGGNYNIEIARGTTKAKRGVNALNIEGEVTEYDYYRPFILDGKRIFGSNEVFKVIREYVNDNPSESVSAKMEEQSKPAPEQPSGGDATLARFRPKQMVVFAKPYVGKTGAKLTGYEWKWRPESIVDKRGEDRDIRVSDWEEAVTNPATNRDIVHQFQVETTDGRVELVSAETAAKMLGVSQSTARASARRLLAEEMQRRAAEAAGERRANEVDAGEWYETPAAAVDALGANKGDAPRRVWIKYKDWGDAKREADAGDYTAQNRWYEMRKAVLWFTKGPKGYRAITGIPDENRGWTEVRLRPEEIWDENGNDRATPTPAPIDNPAPPEGGGKVDDTKEQARPAVEPGTLAAHDDAMDRARDGALSLDEFKAAFASAEANKDRIIADLEKLSIDKLERRMGRRYGSKKADTVRMAYVDVLQDYTLSRGLSYSMGRGALENAIRKMVENTTEQDLKDFAQKVADRRQALEARREEVMDAVKDPQTLEDFELFLRVKKVTDLTPEQLRRYDDLQAAKARERRKAQEERRTQVEAAKEAVGAKIIETKHTRDNYDLFVVQLEKRVEKDDYRTLLAQAKKLGGWYSMYKGNGAVPGFQFKTRENAEAFQKLAAGDTAAATEAVQERRETRREAKKNAAAERLADMADRMEEAAQESLSRDRLANTARRARMANAAEAEARATERMAKTLRTISDAIESGQATNLDGIRNRKQVEELESLLRQAKYEAIRKESDRGGYFEDQKDRPPKESDVTWVRYPQYNGSRSDFAALARRVIEIPGAKMAGERLLKQTDDTKDYAKALAEDFLLLNKVTLGKRTEGATESDAAIFDSKAQAEAAVRRSGMRKDAMVVPMSKGKARGKYVVVLSSAEAKGRGYWQPADDPKIVIPPDLMEEVLDKVEAHNKGKSYGQQVQMGYYPDHIRESRNRLKGMGIETSAELRAALREYIGMREPDQAANKVKELERALAGRADVGFDFFPTPANLAQRMVEALEVEPGMSVLEPSAGKGNLADAVRDAVPGAQIEVIEQSSTLREILDAKGYNLVGQDFNEFDLRGFTYGDVFRHTNGRLGILGSNGGLGSRRYKFYPMDGDERNFTWEDRDDLTGVEKRGTNSGYDRIIMNPPFSSGIDADHVRKAYDLLKPGGKLVAITGEGIFSRNDAKAKAFREWFDSVGGTSEELEGAFTDRREVKTTGVNSRMLVIDKPGDVVKELPLDDLPTPAREGMLRHDQQARDAIELLETVLTRGSGARGAFRAVRLRDDPLIQRIAQSFGKSVVGVRFGENAPAVLTQWQGVTLPGLSDVIYLNESSTRPHLAILGHELVHQLRADNKALYDEFEAAVRGYVNQDAYPEFARKWKMGGAALREEFLGEVASDGFMSETFWSALGEHNATLLERIAKFVRALMVKVANAGGYFSKTDPYLTDFDAVMRVAGQVMARYTNETKARNFEAGWDRMLPNDELLKPYTKEELEQRERDRVAAEKEKEQAEARAERARQGKPLKVDQVDMFNNQGSLFSRQESQGTPLPRQDAEAALAVIAKKWTNAPAIELHENPRTAPPDLLAEMVRKNVSDARGAWSDGKIHLFLNNIDSLESLEQTIVHEARHYGLEGLFGRDLNPILMEMYMKDRDLRLRANELMTSLNLSRVTATNEVLADMPLDAAQKLPGWQKLVARLKQWLSDHGFTRLAAMMQGPTADQITKDILYQVEDFFKNGKRSDTTFTTTMFHRAWHGSPHDFDEFKLQHIGSGEGAQSYGWGMYFAGRREVAEWYKKSLSAPSRELDKLAATKDGRTISGTMDFLAEYFKPGRVVKGYASMDEVIKFSPDDFNGGWSVTVKSVMDQFGRKVDERPRKHSTTPDAVEVRKVLEADGWKFPAGKLYQVELAPKEDEYLDWDGGFDAQSDKVKNALRIAVERMSPAMQKDFWRGTLTGAGMYKAIADSLGTNRTFGPKDNPALQWTGNVTDEEAASKYLLSIGIPGIRYLDGSSRGKGEGHHNYVIFDDSLVKVEAKFSRQDQTQTEAFRKWFGDSKVVDENGAPLVVYHGTGADFDVFQPHSIRPVHRLDGREITEANSWDMGDDRTGMPEGFHYGALSDAAVLGSKEALRVRTEEANRLGHRGKPDTDRLLRDLERLQGGSLTWNAESRPSGSGMWFTPDREYSFISRRNTGEDPGANVMPVYLSIKNPIYLNAAEIESAGFKFRMDKYKEQGYDGAVFASDQKNLARTGWSGATQIVAFEPSQVKSAIGNNGQFDAGNPDIRFSRFSAITTSRPVSMLVDAAMSSPKSLGILNSFNTQYHKALYLAERGKPEFKRVYDKMQNYLTDISAFAVQAEQQAPAIFRELTGIGAKSIGKYFKGAASEADIAAIGPWLNAGTMYGGASPLEGKVWTDAQLKGDFSGTTDVKPRIPPLTDAQVELYKQARAAIDQSIETGAKAVIYRHVKKYGITFDRDMSLEDVVATTKDKIDAAIDENKDRINALQDQIDDPETEFGDEDIRDAHKRLQREIDKAGEQIEALESLKDTLTGIEKQARGLIDHGYMPLKRFGNRTVTARDEQGNVRFFGTYDGTPLVPGSANAEMHKVAREIRELHPDWTVTTGVKAEKAWQMYNGLSLDALENFLDFLDPETKAELDRDGVMQEYLRNAINNRSVLKELIHRKGTPGFSTDVPRILAAFVTSHARNASGMYHIGDAKAMVEDIQKEQGDIRDEASELIRYVTEPGEEAAKLRGFLFFHFLGGSVASAVVNLSQTVMITAPYLTQFAGAGKVVSRLLAASKLAVKDPATMSGDLGNALQKAEQEGVTAPQQIHHLTATAANNPFSSNRQFRTFMTVWGGMFGAAEVFNRRVAFIASYEIAKANNVRDPYAFAKNAVDETQFVYNKGNRPNLGRGAIGATAMTFKQYSIGYLELLKRMPPKQQLMMLGVLILMAGAEGLPFEDDLGDLIDTLGQWLGFSTNTGKWTGKVVEDVFGKELARPILKGLGGVLPVDLHSRLGMGNLLPGTAYFKPSEIDKTRDVAEAIGPLGGVLKSFSDSLQLLARGKWDSAAVNASPSAIKNAYNGIHMMATGESQDTKGRLAMRDVTAIEGAGKAIGFNPQRAARESEIKREEMVNKNLRLVRYDDMASDWADGILKKDQEKVQEAMERLREWNKDNPEMRIDPVVLRRAVYRRVQEARKSSAERFQKSLPKSMRPEAASLLQ